MIPAEAVEALAAVLAQEALVSADMDGHGWDAENDDPAPFMPRARERAHAYLQSAAPYMQQEVDLMRWKLNALSKWAGAMIDESYYPQYGRDVKTILDVSSIEETKEDFGDD